MSGAWRAMGVATGEEIVAVNQRIDELARIVEGLATIVKTLQDQQGKIIQVSTQIIAEIEHIRSRMPTTPREPAPRDGGA